MTVLNLSDMLYSDKVCCCCQMLPEVRASRGQNIVTHNDRSLSEKPILLHDQQILQVECLYVVNEGKINSMHSSFVQVLQKEAHKISLLMRPVIQ